MQVETPWTWNNQLYLQSLEILSTSNIFGKRE